MSILERPLPAADPELARILHRFANEGTLPGEVLPWAAQLSAQDRMRLRGELALVLAEPALTGEPLDWREVMDILCEYAEMAEWDGPRILLPSEGAPADYRVDVRPGEVRALERASAAVQQAARELLSEFLPRHPRDAERLTRGRLKKMSNRGVWQIELPDGYRLRYFVDESERTVHVVYLGPHPDGYAGGREQTLQALVQRRRHERLEAL